MTYPQALILKDDLYNCRKSHNVWLSRIDQTVFEIFSKNPRKCCPPPHPSPNRVKNASYNKWHQVIFFKLVLVSDWKNLQNQFST